MSEQDLVEKRAVFLERLEKVREALREGELESAIIWIREARNIHIQRKKQASEELKVLDGYTESILRTEIQMDAAQLNLVALEYSVRMRNFSGADSLAARIPVSSLQSAKEAAHFVNICLFAGIIQAEDDNVASRCWLVRGLEAASSMNLQDWVVKSASLLLRQSIRLGDFNEAARYIRLVSDSPEKNLILLDLQLKGVMQPDTHLLKEIFSPQLTTANLYSLLQVLKSNPDSSVRLRIQDECTELLSADLLFEEEGGYEDCLVGFYLFLAEDVIRDYSSCYSLLCKFIQHISSLSKDSIEQSKVETVLKISSRIVRKLKSEGSYVFEEVTKMKMDKSTVGKTPPQQKDAVDAVDAVDDENAADAVDTGDAVASVDTVATVDAVNESDGKKKSAQGNNLQQWLDTIAYLALVSSQHRYWNYTAQLWVGECLEREEYRKGLDYVESQLRGQPNNWKLLQLGLILSVKSDDKDTMTKFLDQLISNHNDTDCEGLDVCSMIHWVLSSLAGDTQQKCLVSAIEMLQNNNCFNNPVICKIAIQISFQLNRRDLADGFLTREYLEKFPEIGAEEKTFLAQLLFNLGLEKESSLDKLRMLLLAAEMMDVVATSVAVHLVAISAGLKGMEEGMFEGRDEVLDAIRNVEKMSTSRRSRSAILIYQIRYSVLSGVFSAFNLRAAVDELASMEKFSVLNALAVMLAKKNVEIADQLTVQALMLCLPQSSEPSTIGVAVLEVTAKKPFLWPNIFSIYTEIKQRLEGKERIGLQIVWNAWIKLTSLSGDNKALKEGWGRCVVGLHNQLTHEFDHIQANIHQPSQALYAKIRRSLDQ